MIMFFVLSFIAIILMGTWHLLVAIEMYKKVNKEDRFLAIFDMATGILGILFGMFLLLCLKDNFHLFK